MELQAGPRGSKQLSEYRALMAALVGVAALAAGSAMVPGPWLDVAGWALVVAAPLIWWARSELRFRRRWTQICQQQPLVLDTEAAHRPGVSVAARGGAR